jgi:hypothetical protein
MARYALEGDERGDWRRRSRTPNTGPVSFVQLPDSVSGEAQALDALPDLIMTSGGDHNLQPAAPNEVDREPKTTS